MLAAALALAATAIPPLDLPLVPRPNSVVRGEGRFVLNTQTRIVAPAALRPMAKILQDSLRPATGLPLTVVVKGERNTVDLSLDPSALDLGDEGYRLVADETGVRIVALKPAGVLYGIQTLRQLLPASIFAKERVSGTDWVVPAVTILDKPRFGWRGMMLDVARQYLPTPFLYEFIDTLAAHKMNRLHLHLTDDQGWRIEIKRYPKLTSIGSKRNRTMLVYPDKYEDKPHGGFYTQDELRALVRYAAERNITIVPEIEMPGHAQAAIASYPELGVSKKPLPVSETWGVHENVFNVEWETIRFLQNVLDEVMEIFPSEFIHIGGDEAPKVQWKADARTQALMRQRGIKDEYALQSWFIRQMDRYLTSKGRRLIGWDEILEGGLAENATVMSWRSIEGGIAAARTGNDVVMAPTSHTYLDYYQSRKPGEPHAIGGFLPLETVYAFEPIPAALTPEEEKHILGAQGQIWGEYIRTPDHVEYMGFPRGIALAEVLWSDRAHRDYPQFFERLQGHLPRLDRMGVNYRKLDSGAALRVGGWRSGEIGKVAAERIWELGGTVTQPGSYVFRFQYSGGAHRLDIDWVEILEGEQVVARVERKGRTGANDDGNEYEFDLSRVNLSARHRLRARVRADGGNDSNGDIWVARRLASE